MASLGKLTASLALDIGSFVGGLDKSSYEVQKFQRQIAKDIDRITAQFKGLAAGVIGVAAAFQVMRGSVDAAAKLDDLADSTGIAVERLDQLALAAKLSGQETTELQRDLFNLSKAVVEASNPASTAAKVFEALGVSIKRNANGSVDLAAAYEESIKQLAAIEDRTVRAAAAQEIFGKGAKEMIARIDDQAKNMAIAAEQIRVFGSYSTEGAQAAEDFGKTLTLGKDALERMSAPLIQALNPALRDAYTAFAAAEQGGAGLAKTMGTLLAGAIEYGTKLLLGFWYGLQAAGKGIAAVAAGLAAFASGGPRAALAVFSEYKADMDQLDVSLKKAMAAAGGQAQSTVQVGQAAASAVPNVKALAAALAKTGDNTKAASDKLKVYLDQLDYIAKQLKDEEEARKKRIDAENERLARNWDEQQKLLKTIQDQGAAYQKQAEQLTLGEAAVRRKHVEELAALATAQAMETLAGEELALALERITAAKNLALAQATNLDFAEREKEAAKQLTEEAKKRADEESRYAQQIGDALTDALMRGFENGKDAAKNFRDSMINLFKTMVLKPVIQAIVQPLGNAVAGFFGGGSALGGSGSGLIGSMGSQIGNYFGLTNPYGSGFSLGNNTWGGGLGPQTITAADGFSYAAPGSFFGSGTSFAGGTASFSGMLGGAGIGMAVGGLGSELFGNERNKSGISTGATIGGAIGSIWGPVGALIGSALGAAIGSLVKSGGGPKTGGYAITDPAFGYDRATHWTPNQQDSKVKEVVETLSSGYSAALSLLGGTGTAVFGMGYDTDPQGTANNRLDTTAYVNGQQAYHYWSGDDSLGRDAATLEARMKLEGQRAILAALQASDLPAQVAQVLNSITAASAEATDIDKIIKTGATVNGLLMMIADFSDPMEVVSGVIENANRTLLGSFQLQGESLTALLDEVDASAEGIDQLAAATNAYGNAAVNALLQIEQLKEGIAAMFADTRRTIENVLLSPEEQYNRARDEANSLLAQLSVETDPARVAAISEQINGLINEAFGLLSPEQQAAMAPEFLADLDRIDQIAAERLENIGTTITNETEDLMTRVGSKLDEIVGKIAAAGDKFEQGASAIDAAVGDGIDVRVTVNVPELGYTG